MVDDRITDGTRIGQLLASELTGLETGVLADVTIADANPDVSPTPEGSFAYAIVFEESQIGSVTVYPDHARVSIRTDQPAGSEEPALGDTSIPVETESDELHLRVESGVAVKRAVDVLREVLTDRA